MINMKHQLFLEVTNVIKEEVLSKILECDAAKFQRICDSYFRKNGFANIVSYGLTIKGKKTKKGTPDSYSINEYGEYIFFEYTTEQKNIGEKLKNDVNKCIDKVSKKNCNKIKCKEIIFVAASNNIDPILENTVMVKCKENDIQLKVICLNQLCDMLLQTGKNIIEDEFNMVVNYSPVCSIGEFIQRNSNIFGIDFSKKMYGRENDLKNLSELLQLNDAIVVSGESGVGKTKLVLEYLKDVKDKVIIVQNRSGDITHDIYMEVGENEKCIIFFDDANGVLQLKNVLEDIRLTKKNVKIIFTVRNYAKNYINEILSQFKIKYSEYIVCSLNSSEIKNIIEKNYGITNYEQRNRIIEITNGNARTAAIACEKIIENEDESSIWNNSAALLNDFYTGVIKSNNKMNYAACKKILCILATLKKIDLKNNSLIEKICSSIEIERNNFIGEIYNLHNIEIVDIYLNRVVQITDQCLQDYFLYDGYVKSKFLSLREIAKDYFNSHNGMIIDSINSILNIYTSENGNEFIKNEIILLWNELENESKLDVKFVYAFSSIDYNRAISWIEEKIFNDKTKCKWDYNNIKETSYFNDDFLKILEHIFYSELDDCSLSLIFESLGYKELRKEAMSIIKRIASIQKDDFENNFCRQYKLIDVLLMLKEEEYFDDITCDIATELFKYNYSSYRNIKKRTVEYCHFSINDEMSNCIELRNYVWKLLKSVKKSPHLFNVIYNYFNEYSENAKKIFINDISNIEDIMHDSHFTKNEEIIIYSKAVPYFTEFKSSWKHMEEKYKNDMENINLLLNPKDNKFIYADKESNCKLNIKKVAKNDSLENGENRLLSAIEMYNISKEYNLAKFVNFYLCYCNDNVIEWVLETIEKFVDCFKQLVINSIGKRIINDSCFEQKISIIKSEKIKNEFKAYYVMQSINSNENTKKYCKEMFSYDFANVNYVPLISRRIELIYKQCSDDKEFCSVIEFINKNKSKNHYICESYYSILFNKYVFNIQKLMEIFSNNLSTLEVAFLNHLSFQKMNYDESTYYFTICDYDANFFNSSIEYFLVNRALYTIVMKKIWKQSNKDIYATKIFNCLFKKINVDWKFTQFFENYFVFEMNTEYKDYDSIFEWASKMIDIIGNDSEKCIYLTKIVAKTNSFYLINFLGHLINSGISKELFEKLSIESFNISYSGSRSLQMENKIKFYQDLLQIIKNKVKQRGIVLIIIKRIDELKRYILEAKVQENIRGY